MSRPKKIGTYLNIKLEQTLYNRLIEVSAEAGQTKTVITERALAAYFEDYDKKQTILQEHSDNKPNRDA